MGSYGFSEMDSTIITLETLENPVYSHPDWSVKDACVAANAGEYVIFFSAFFHARGKERSHISAVRTRDFRVFSEPLFLWSGEADGWTGLCSPNISRIDDEFVLTFNSWGNEHPNGRKNQLFYSTSKDLLDWSIPKPLASNLTMGIRAIDAAITLQEVYFLVWKERQTPQFAFAESLDGEWTRMTGPALGWFENAQFVHLPGGDYLLFTGKGHQPILVEIEFSLSVDGPTITAGLPRQLFIPIQEFNTHDHANAAFLWSEAGPSGDTLYLIYAGSTEGESHAGRGYNQLGIARSTDGISWSVPR